MGMFEMNEDEQFVDSLESAAGKIKPGKESIYKKIERAKIKIIENESNSPGKAHTRNYIKRDPER